jgi:hypothetical protein
MRAMKLYTIRDSSIPFRFTKLVAVCHFVVSVQINLLEFVLEATPSAVTVCMYPPACRKPLSPSRPTPHLYLGGIGLKYQTTAQLVAYLQSYSGVHACFFVAKKPYVFATFSTVEAAQHAYTCISDMISKSGLRQECSAVRHNVCDEQNAAAVFEPTSVEYAEAVPPGEMRMGGV